MPSGSFRLKFMDIAATVNPSTVHFRSLTDPTKLDVIEQNYEYDLLDPAKLLHKYVGKEVTLERSFYENNAEKREQYQATLLADNNGTVWKVGNDIVTNPPVSGYYFCLLYTSSVSDGADSLSHSQQNSSEAGSGPLALPPDPHREKYIVLFCAALRSALERLEPTDHRRICLYLSLIHISYNAAENVQLELVHWEKVSSPLTARTNLSF